jgi:hypothetical protein
MGLARCYLSFDGSSGNFTVRSPPFLKSYGFYTSTRFFEMYVLRIKSTPAWLVCKLKSNLFQD